jgi:3-hydroxybutyryl-CoA dehydrogenase
MQIAVIGAGTMGRGIAQLLAQAGHTVRIYDAVPGAAAKGVAAVKAVLDKEAAKGKLAGGEARAILARLLPAEALAALVDCELVFEAVFEDLEVKRALFRELEEIVAPGAILATNTSSFLVADIAAACRDPGRVAGAHFFNPVPLMRVVEIIAALRTRPEVVERLSALLSAAGHRTVTVQDQSGFLINHIGRGLYTEGLRILEEGVTSQAGVDELMREAAGFRMGPFELLDLTGLDVSGKVMQSIFEQFQYEPRFRPSTLVPPRIAAGLHGRKTGGGWYTYRDGQKVLGDPPPPPPPPPSGCRVWIDPAAADAERLRRDFAGAGAAVSAEPGGDSLLVIQPWGLDATGAANAAGLDPARCVAIDPLPGLDRRLSLMLTVATAARHRDTALALLQRAGHRVTLIADSPGFVVQRVLATIVNIAAEAAQRGIASVPDLEDAVVRGLGYPAGPLALGDGIGARRVVQILDGIHETTRDPRYRPSLWLRRRAQAGLPLRTPGPALTA